VVAEYFVDGVELSDEFLQDGVLVLVVLLTEEFANVVEFNHQVAHVLQVAVELLGDVELFAGLVDALLQKLYESVKHFYVGVHHIVVHFNQASGFVGHKSRQDAFEFGLHQRPLRVLFGRLLLGVDGGRCLQLLQLIVVGLRH